MTVSEFVEFREKLASLGAEQVRLKLSQGVWANRRKQWAENWLREQKTSEEDHREEEHLRLAKEANAIARCALKESRVARFVSIIAILVSAATAIVVALIQFNGAKK